MHTLSTRTLSALAYDRGEEYDPSQPIATDLLETLSLVEHAAPVIGDDGPYERARRCRRERRQLNRISPSGSRRRTPSPRHGRPASSASPSAPIPFTAAELAPRRTP